MFDHPYAPHFCDLERPGRYVGGEFGAIATSKNADVKIALGFPDAYEIGMSHIGLSVLYEIVNKIPGMAAERVFMPWPDLEAVLKKHGLPLVSLETATPLREFDVVGFSLQYELCYTNLVAMLSLSGIPRKAEMRKSEDPLIIVGGPGASHCEPIAPFLDLCLVGDGEQALPEMLEHMAALKKQGKGRVDLIEKLSDLPAVFAPSRLKRSIDPVTKRTVVDLKNGAAAKMAVIPDLGDYPTGFGPVPTVKSVFDRYSFEVARGCSAGCRFCQAGFLYRPVRERTEDQAGQAVERAVGCLGFDDVSLAALSTADHSRIDPMVSMLDETFTKRRVSFSVPSLRAYGLDAKLVKVLSRMRAMNVTMAPEAGSQRLRDVINKNVTEADLMEAATRFFESGITRIKLYFMIGLPGETDEDLAEIVELAARLRNMGTEILGRKPAVTVSVSTFVPKPFTPFERERMNGFSEIRSKQNLIRKLCRQKRLEVRVHNPELSILEGILCRGDSTLAPLIERAVESGARFDGWGEMYNKRVWNRIFDKMDISSELGEIPPDVRLPWDHVDVGIETDFLKKEKARADKHKTTPPCGRFFRDASKKDRVICHNCGIGCRPESLPIRSIREPKETSSLRAERKNVRSEPKPIPRVGTESSTRVRLFYSKWGRQAYVGHLDTMRHINYSLRRAGLVLDYTRGFHPKPRVESAPALPLGVSGIEEPIDVFLIDPPSEDEILKRLGLVVPRDLAFVDAKTIESVRKSLSKEITAAEYVALVSASREEVIQGVEQLKRATSFVVERIRKKKTKEVDLIPFIEEVSVLDGQPENLRVPNVQNRIPIRFVLKITGEGSARPKEILKAILSITPVDPWIVRTRLIFGAM